MADVTFGPFTIDLAGSRVLREGTELRMRPQAFHVLRTLAAHGGRIIDLEQLIREAWGGTAVSRHTVHVTIAEVQLGQPPGHPAEDRRRDERGGEPLRARAHPGHEGDASRKVADAAEPEPWAFVEAVRRGFPATERFWTDQEGNDRVREGRGNGEPTAPGSSRRRYPIAS